MKLPAPYLLGRAWLLACLHAGVLRETGQQRSLFSDGAQGWPFPGAVGSVLEEQAEMGITCHSQCVTMGDGQAPSYDGDVVPRDPSRNCSSRGLCLSWERSG